MRIYPNAKINEIRKKARKMKYPPRGGMKKYRKGNFLYLLDADERICNAYYKPENVNFKDIKPVMFDWDDDTKIWKRLRYYSMVNTWAQ